MSYKIHFTRKGSGQSFKHCPVMTIPDQSMSVKEIMMRFVRREALPVEKQGAYLTGYGDIEKVRHKDILEKFEVAQTLKDKIAAGEKAKVVRDQKSVADKKARIESKKASRAKVEPNPLPGPPKV